MNKEIIQQIVKEIQVISEKNLLELVNGDGIHKAGGRLLEDIQKIGIMILRENIEEIDRRIREIPGRKGRYKVDGVVEKRLLVELGEVKYNKTRYYDEKEKEYIYLLDKYLQIESSERMSDGVKCRILEEAIETSYKKGGKNASITVELTKGTTKNVIDRLDEELIKVEKRAKKKKEVEYLYIDADEAHVNIQTRNRIKKNAISKLAYVYEGIDKETEEGKRSKLREVYYISGIYEGEKGNNKLWREVLEYIDNNYEIEKIKRIYINGDGGKWIKEGVNVIPNSEFVMDKLHMYMHMKAATSHLKDSQQEAISEIYKAIYHRSRDELDITFSNIVSSASDRKEEMKIYNNYTYFNDNFDSICLRMSKDENIVGCSAEGHVSHVLASRMTSRPMGWSISNANKMSKLRAYVLNGGKINELLEDHRYKIDFTVDYELPKIEKKVIKTTEYYKDIYSEIGKYYDTIHVDITNEIKKKFELNNVF